MKYKYSRYYKLPRAPLVPADRLEPPSCTVNERCVGCHYPAHGFRCWHSDGSCMKTDVEKSLGRMNERSVENASIEGRDGKSPV